MPATQETKSRAFLTFNTQARTEEFRELARGAKSFVTMPVSQGSFVIKPGDSLRVLEVANLKPQMAYTGNERTFLVSHADRSPLGSDGLVILSLKEKKPALEMKVAVGLEIGGAGAVVLAAADVLREQLKNGEPDPSFTKLADALSKIDPEDFEVQAKARDQIFTIPGVNYRDLVSRARTLLLRAEECGGQVSTAALREALTMRPLKWHDTGKDSIGFDPEHSASDLLLAVADVLEKDERGTVTEGAWERSIEMLRRAASEYTARARAASDKGQESMARILLGAKNHWMDRARSAEARLAAVSSAAKKVIEAPRADGPAATYDAIDGFKSAWRGHEAPCEVREQTGHKQESPLDICVEPAGPGWRLKVGTYGGRRFFYPSREQIVSMAEGMLKAVGRIPEAGTREAEQADTSRGLLELRDECLARRGRLLELLEHGWAVIANSYGSDWDKGTCEWKRAAEAFRDEYHDIIKQDPDDEADSIVSQSPVDPAACPVASEFTISTPLTRAATEVLRQIDWDLIGEEKWDGAVDQLRAALGPDCEDLSSRLSPERIEEVKVGVLEQCTDEIRTLKDRLAGVEPLVRAAREVVMARDSASGQWVNTLQLSAAVEVLSAELQPFDGPDGSINADPAASSSVDRAILCDVFDLLLEHEQECEPVDTDKLREALGKPALKGKRIKVSHPPVDLEVFRALEHVAACALEIERIGPEKLAPGPTSNAIAMLRRANGLLLVAKNPQLRRTCKFCEKDCSLSNTEVRTVEIDKDSTKVLRADPPYARCKPMCPEAVAEGERE